MKKNNADLLTREALESPLIGELRDLAYSLCGVSFVIVYPEETGWGQITPSKKQVAPEFCQRVWQARDGAKRCRMCHVLMSVTAWTQGITEQRCHAGASVLIMPIAEKGQSSFALLSTCLFKPGTEKDVDPEAKKARNPAPHSEEIDRAYRALPTLTEEQEKETLVIMRLLREVIRELSVRLGLEKQIVLLNEALSTRNNVGRAVAHELRTAFSTVPAPEAPTPSRKNGEPRTASSELHTALHSSLTTRPPTDGKKPAPAGKSSPVAETVAAMIRDRPNMAFRVADIASAARMTPNHFSTLFHRCMSMSFSRFLTEQRMEMAKRLLRDQTINIQEVAIKCGYSDPGYFTRRFRQETRMTPREWRSSLHRSHRKPVNPISPTRYKARSESRRPSKAVRRTWRSPD